MATYVDATQVVNAALEQVATQTRITSLTDGSAAALAANVIYVPTVQLMLREIEPDFSRFTAVLETAPGTPGVPWAYQYLYPADCLRMRQIQPPTYDVNDPYQVRFNTGVALVASVLTKVVLTNEANALGVYTTSAVTEAQWDSVFADAVVRRLANPLAMALSGRPDFAREILEQSARVAATAEAVDDTAFRRG